MKKIEKDELYEHLRGFLKSKGIALDSGTYTQRIHQGCNFLADAINAAQKTVERARAEADKQLDQLRQSIHEATAPRSSAASPDPSATGKSAQADGQSQRRRSAKSHTKSKTKTGSSTKPDPT